MRVTLAVILLAIWNTSLQAEEHAVSVLKISEEHKACNKDSDCTIFSLECSCDCGQPINVKFLGEYLTVKDDKCETYSGRLCKMKCPGPEAVACIGNKCVFRDSVASYDSDVPYQLDVPIKFADIVVTYKGDILESGHEKITSQAFEITSGSETKKLTVPPLSMSGTLVRFGIHYYRLHVRWGYKLLTVKKGIW